MPLVIEVEQENDGRWIAEVPDLPGVLAYGQTRQEAIDRAQSLSLRVLADRLDHGERVPQMTDVFSVTVSYWPATKARRVLAALLRIGWNVKRHSGSSHRVLERPTTCLLFMTMSRLARACSRALPGAPVSRRRIFDTGVFFRNLLLQHCTRISDDRK